VKRARPERVSDEPATYLKTTDVQILSDIRLMALSMLKICEGSAERVALSSAMRRIASQCEDFIAIGPYEHRHIIEECVPLEVIQSELRRSVYSHAP
jgi:hypothetical protein